MKLDLIVMALTAVPVVFGLLLGLIRGSRRSILRLVLVLACIVTAYFVKDLLTDKLMTVEIGGQTVPQYVQSALESQSQEFASLGDDVVIPLIKSILNVFSFLALFLALQFVTWAILYPICKIFVKKGKNVDGVVKKHGFIGLIIGTVQGVAVALVLCIVLNGLLVNVDKVISATQEIQQDGGTAASVSIEGGVYADTEGGSGGGGEGGSGALSNMDLAKMLSEYSESGISKMYTKIGGGAFDLIARTTVVDPETNEKKTVTFSGQIDVLNYAVKMYKEVDAISKLDPNDITSFANGIKESFQRLGELNGSISKEETKETINKIVSTVLGSESSPVKLDNINFTEIDFTKEGEIVADLATISEKPEEITEERARELVKEVADSDLILPIVDSVLTDSNKNDLLQLDESKKEIVTQEIQKLKDQGVEQSKIDILNNIFGLNSANGGSTQTPAE